MPMIDSAPLGEWLAHTALLAGAPAAVTAMCASEARQISLAPGTTLIRAGERTYSLYLILHGRLQVRLPGPHHAGHALAQLEEGDVLGEIQAVTGQASTADAVAVGPCTVLEFNRELLHHIAEGFEAFDQRLTQLATCRLRRIIFRRTVDALLAGMEPALVDALIAAATEVVLERGACLFSQGDVADAWYVLTSGRLSVVTQAADAQQRIADLMPGASVGEMALIIGGRRSATVMAEREASLMRLAKSDFERFADAHPAFARRLMGMVVQRLSEPNGSKRANAAQVLVVLRATDSPQLEAAFNQLGIALKSIAAAAVCTRRDFEKAIDRPIGADLAETHPVWNRFDVWLEEAQRAHAIVLIDAGHTDDLWHRECLLHADRCLWLAEPVAPTAARPPERLLARLLGARQWALRDAQRLPWSLLLAHSADAQRPVNTRAWLDGESFDRHFHLRIDDPTTMERTARLLAGKGIGVALSGGGARGLAHIGVLKALVERDVPIDCIGGTSFGAIQAGMFALGLPIADMVRLNLEVIAQKPFTEYTLPVIALVASRRRDAGIRHSFGDIRIEDLWIPFLAVSTDLRAAQAVVHERGSLGLAISASSSLPGVLVPVIDGPRILVDGGIVNNLPADLIKARCGGTVFGVKAAPDDDLVAPAGGFPSAWSVVWHRLLPWLAPIPTPRLGDLLIRTMTVSSAERMQQVTATVDVLIEPDVASFGMLQFGAIEALIEKGFAAAQQPLEEWAGRSKTR